MNTGKIYSTNDYDAFSFIGGNRNVYQPHLSRLIKSIGEHNLLEQNPIIVNIKNQVIDGQHRLLAAKALSLPVYYTISETSDLVDVQLLNVNNRAWTTDDFLDSYVALGKKEYIKLQEFAEEYKISIPIAIVVLTDTYTTHASIIKAFREGKFAVKDIDKAHKVASFLTELRRFSPDNSWADRRCMQAVVEVIKEIDPKKVIKQLSDYGLMFTKRYSKQEYLNQFTEILSFGQK